MAKMNWDKVRVQSMGARHGYETMHDTLAALQKSKRKPKKNPNSPAARTLAAAEARRVGFWEKFKREDREKAQKAETEKQSSLPASKISRAKLKRQKTTQKMRSYKRRWMEEGMVISKRIDGKKD